MAIIENETRTQPGACSVHGQVDAEQTLPKLTFPFLVTGPARMLASLRGYRCPICDAATRPV